MVHCPPSMTMSTQCWVMSATEDLADSAYALRDVARGPISSVQPVPTLAIMDGREAEQADVPHWLARVARTVFIASAIPLIADIGPVLAGRVATGRHLKPSTRSQSL